MSTGNFYGPQEDSNTRALSHIEDSNYPDVNTDFVKLVQKHDYQIHTLARDTKKALQSANTANENPIQQIQDFIGSLTVLLDGGELTRGLLDFGDLQYILPALGALFGFGDGPFPINLFYAAEKLFTGYIVPTRQWTDEVNRQINAWATTFGIDKKFISDLNRLITLNGDTWGTFENLFTSIDNLFDKLGMNSGDLGPLGDLLAPIIKMFSGIDLTKFGDMVEFITNAMDPWIIDLADQTDKFNRMIEAFADGVDNLAGITNFAELWTGFTNLLAIPFSPESAWQDIVDHVLVPKTNLLGSQSLINAANLIGELPSWVFGNIPITAISQVQTNLLSNPHFTSALSIAGGDHWMWDGNVYITLDSDDNSSDEYAPGSARTDAAGEIREIDSNKFPVTSGNRETVHLQIGVLAHELEGDGDLVKLQIIPWKTDDVPESAVTVATLSAAPTDDPTDWTHPPDGAASAVLSGDYEVEPGVHRCQVRLLVTANATSGRVWFDGASAVLTGGLLLHLLDDFNKGNQAFSTLMTNAWNHIQDDFSDWGQLFTDVSNDWNTYITTVTALANDEWLTLTDLFEKIFHINTSTGKIDLSWMEGFLPKDQVDGLEDDLDALTQAQQTSNTAYQNLLNGWWEALTGQDSNGDQTVETWTSAWDEFTDVLAGVQQAQNGAWQDIWNRLFHLNSDGTFNAGSLSGSISHNALPGSFANIGQDFLNLINDVIFANGRDWSDIGPDLSALINDFLGGTTSHTVTPGQIPATHVGSTGNGANIGTDVAGAQGTATSAANDAADVASQISGIVSPNLPAVPTWVIAWPEFVSSGHPGVGAAGDDIWYRVTALNGYGESVGSSAVYAHALLGPIAVKLTWVAVPGATGYRVYRGISANPWLIAPSEPALTHYTNVGNVTEWTDEGD